MKALRSLFIFIKRYKYSFFAGIALIILSQLVNNFSAILVKYFFEGVENYDKQLLLKTLYAFVILEGLNLLISPLSNIVHDNYLIKASRDLKIAVFNKLHELDFDFHANKRSGSLISMIKRGDGAFWSYNIEIFRGLLKIFIDLIFVSVVFFTLDKLLSAVITISFVVNLIFTYFLIRVNVKKRDRLNNEEDKISGIIGDNLINYETVNVFAQEKQEQKRLYEQYKGWINAVWSYANTFRLIEVWTGLLTLISLILIIFISINKVEAKEFSTGDFALTLTFSFMFFPRLKDLIFRLRELAKHETDLSKYTNILDLEIGIKEKENAERLKDIQGQIDFNNVNFKYSDRTTVLESIDLHIKPNESIALVGKSGAGKTTLVKLLLRFYDPTSGEIMIDGKDIRDITKESLRSNIGVVPQEALMFNNTIGFNIAYGKPEASMEEIKEAAKMANLDSFIESLPEKYATVVGERGIKLSGGQKQRLAIARMVLENPPIIIFDEATSQLDSESERLIQEAFWKIAENKTTIVIAHRLSTIMKSDRIIVLENGKIVEKGTHKELIKLKNGVYKSLWNLQTGRLKD